MIYVQDHGMEGAKEAKHSRAVLSPHAHYQRLNSRYSTVCLGYVVKANYASRGRKEAAHWEACGFRQPQGRNKKENAVSELL